MLCWSQKRRYLTFQRSASSTDDDAERRNVLPNIVFSGQCKKHVCRSCYGHSGFRSGLIKTGEATDEPESKAAMAITRTTGVFFALTRFLSPSNGSSFLWSTKHPPLSHCVSILHSGQSSQSGEDVFWQRSQLVETKTTAEEKNARHYIMAWPSLKVWGYQKHINQSMQVLYQNLICVCRSTHDQANGILWSWMQHTVIDLYPGTAAVGE